MYISEKQRDLLIEELSEMDDDSVLSIIREITSYDGSLEDESWEDIDSFDELLNGSVEREGAWWLACRIFYGDFRPRDSYWKFDAYGNLKSTDYLNFDNNTYESIVDSVENIPEDYIPNEILDILNNADEEDEEDTDYIVDNTSDAFGGFNN